MRGKRKSLTFEKGSRNNKKGKEDRKWIKKLSRKTIKGERREKGGKGRKEGK